VGGHVDFNDLRFNNPLGNDAVSSMELIGADSVILCDANNWTTGCYKVESHGDTVIPDFRYFPLNGGTINFNDKLTSFKYQTYGTGDILKLYDGQYLTGGTCDLYYPFDYNYPPCNFNDRASSWKFFNYTGPTRAGWFYLAASFDWYNDSDWYTNLQVSVNTFPAPYANYDNAISSFMWWN
jgi:hypothetical protein